METIYVTGHKNPDTDSIVSAMAYAGLQRALGNNSYVAARLGHVSDETKAILDRFEMEPPELIRNVRTQVKDLDFDTPPCMQAGVTVARAWHHLQDDDTTTKVIPVINSDGTLYGMLSPGDVANYDMRSVNDPHIENIPLFNLLGAIEGKIMNEAGNFVDTVSGEVVIALPQSVDNLLFEDPNSIVVCGDQPDMIRRAIEKGVKCIIVCQAQVDEEFKNDEIGTCIISTPYEAYRAVRKIFQSTPISRICAHNELTCFHLNDYIDDVKEIVLKSRFRAYPILDENEKVVGTLSRYHLLRPRRKKVVLVDHNEMAQTVPGLEQAELLAIVDHHRLADIQTGNPVFVRNEPVGSTATIVATMYQDRGLMPSEKMAGLLACAIISDTVMFKSPTCTQTDKNVAARMARIAHVSLDELGTLVFSSSNNSSKDVNDLIFTDFKEFHIAGHAMGVGQVTCLDSLDLLERKAEFLQVMEDEMKRRNYDFIIMMLTDVLLEGSQLIFLGDEDTIAQAFSCNPAENCVFLPKVMSRKKQVIPMLTTMWG